VAQSGNGIDIGTVYGLLTQMSARLDQLLEVVNDHSRILNDHSRILNDHSRILGDHARELGDLKVEMREMRSEIRLYHDAVTGQGIHYSELEGRVQRVERHLKLEPSGE
jgi:chromosome segregation ATPase